MFLGTETFVKHTLKYKMKMNLLSKQMANFRSMLNDD